MKFPQKTTSKEKVEILERYILVHSYLYYHENTSVISDKRYDKASKFLVSKIEKYGPNKIAKTQYGYVFKDFDGNTGFDLIDRLTKKDRDRIRKVATHVLRSYEGRR